MLRRPRAVGVPAAKLPRIRGLALSAIARGRVESDQSSVISDQFSCEEISRGAAFSPAKPQNCYLISYQVGAPDNTSYAGP